MSRKPRNNWLPPAPTRTKSIARERTNAAKSRWTTYKQRTETYALCQPLPYPSPSLSPSLWPAFCGSIVEDAASLDRRGIVLLISRHSFDSASASVLFPWQFRQSSCPRNSSIIRVRRSLDELSMFLFVKSWLWHATCNVGRCQASPRVITGSTGKDTSPFASGRIPGSGREGIGHT